jgi:hypothetical protein
MPPVNATIPNRGVAAAVQTKKDASETLPESQPAPSRSLTHEEKLQQAKENLAKVTAQHEEAIRRLKDNPSMELNQRNHLKKLLPVFEDKIKRLKLDVQAIESIMKMAPDDIENPPIAKHYQNYSR